MGDAEVSLHLGVAFLTRTARLRYSAARAAADMTFRTPRRGARAPCRKTAREGVRYGAPRGPAVNAPRRMDRCRWPTRTTPRRRFACWW